MNKNAKKKKTKDKKIHKNKYGSDRNVKLRSIINEAADRTHTPTREVRQHLKIRASSISPNEKGEIKISMGDGTRNLNLTKNDLHHHI